MKKMQRIMALIGVILLILMYISTLIFALIDHSATMIFFKSAIAATIFIPVVLYAMILFTRLSDRNASDQTPSEDKKEE